MEGKNNSKKELTLEDLAGQIASGFGQVNKRFGESRKYTKKLINEKIEWLARITQNNFSSIEGQLDGVENDIKKVKSDTEDIKAGLNKKVDIFEYKELEFRVEKVEEKVGITRRRHRTSQ
jgi:hypothetical protein